MRLKIEIITVVYVVIDEYIKNKTNFDFNSFKQDFCPRKNLPSTRLHNNR